VRGIAFKRVHSFISPSDSNSSSLFHLRAKPSRICSSQSGFKWIIYKAEKPSRIAPKRVGGIIEKQLVSLICPTKYTYDIVDLFCRFVMVGLCWLWCTFRRVKNSKVVLRREITLDGCVGVSDITCPILEHKGEQFFMRFPFEQNGETNSTIQEGNSS